MSPARQRVELQGVAGDEGLEIDVLAAALGLVLEAAVKPDALEGLALGQGVNALETGPLAATEHEIRLARIIVALSALLLAADAVLLLAAVGPFIGEALLAVSIAAYAAGATPPDEQIHSRLAR